MSDCKKIVDALKGSELFNAAFQMPNTGVLRASLSPENNPLLTLLDPKRNDGFISWEEKQGGGCVPKVNFRFLDSNDTYAVRETPGCTAPVASDSFTDASFTVEKYRESGFSLNECSINMLCGELETAQNAITGKVRSGQNVYLGRHGEYVKSHLIKSVKGIIKSMNDLATESLIDMVGVNPVVGTDAPQTIKLWGNTDEKAMLRHFLHHMDKLRRRRNLTGKLILVTGDDELLAWFKDVCNFGCCTDYGFNYSLVNTSGYEVYFDRQLNDELGDGGFLVLEPLAFTTVNVDRWRNLKAGVGKDQIANTKYGNFIIAEPSIRKVAAESCLQEIPPPVMFFDLRLREVDCDGGNYGTAIHFLPSATFDFFNRPADAEGVTGVYRFKVEAYTAGGAATYNVSFDSDGGSAVVPQFVNAGGKPTEPTAPTKSGHTFGGWYKDEALTSTWTFASDVVSADTILYAKWTAVGG